MRTRAQVHKKSQKITKAIEKLAGRKGSSEQKRVREEVAQIKDDKGLFGEEVAERRGRSVEK